MASLARNSLTEERRTALPSPRLKKKIDNIVQFGIENLHVSILLYFMSIKVHTCCTCMSINSIQLCTKCC